MVDIKIFIYIVKIMEQYIFILSNVITGKGHDHNIISIISICYLEVFWPVFAVADGHDDVDDGREAIESDVAAARLLRQLREELGRASLSQTLHAVNTHGLNKTDTQL